MMLECALKVLMHVLVDLTPREREIVNARVRGLPYKLIAGELGITVGTVKNHFSVIFLKLHVESSLQLMLLLQQLDAAEASTAE
jgi:DNA-binding NarL/FixJ family response regulator